MSQKAGCKLKVAKAVKWWPEAKSRKILLVINLKKDKIINCELITFISRRLKQKKLKVAQKS